MCGWRRKYSQLIHGESIASSILASWLEFETVECTDDYKTVWVKGVPHLEKGAGTRACKWWKWTEVRWLPIEGTRLAHCRHISLHTLHAIVISLQHIIAQQLTPLLLLQDFSRSLPEALK
jgi:hypothetical protein